MNVQADARATKKDPISNKSQTRETLPLKTMFTTFVSIELSFVIELWQMWTTKKGGNIYDGREWWRMLETYTMVENGISMTIVFSFTPQWTISIIVLCSEFTWPKGRVVCLESMLPIVVQKKSILSRNWSTYHRVTNLIVMMMFIKRSVRSFGLLDQVLCI